MRIALDTNVVLDVLLERDPFAAPAATVFSLAEKSEIEAFLCATTVTTIDYILSKSLSRKDARRALRGLLTVFQVAPVNRAVIEEALQSGLSDFEDAVLAYAARAVGADAVVTRNLKDFKKSPVTAMDPKALLTTWELRRRMM